MLSYNERVLTQSLEQVLPVCKECCSKEFVCCCQACAEHDGFLNVDPNPLTLSQVTYLIRRFKVDDRRLFSGDLGCTLPRRFRSVGCNTFLCDKARRAMTSNIQYTRMLTAAYHISRYRRKNIRTLKLENTQ
jgi:hypothetical protein